MQYLLGDANVVVVVMLNIGQMYHYHGNMSLDIP